MNVKLINAIDMRIIDKFKMNKSLGDTIKHLKEIYPCCQIECGNGKVYCYISGR